MTGLLSIRGTVAVISLLATSSVMAELPGPSFLETVTTSSNIEGEFIFHTQGSHTGTGVTGSNKAFTNTASSQVINGAPIVQVSGTEGSAPVAELFYNYELVGPENTMVPLILTGTVSENVPEGGGASAQASITTGIPQAPAICTSNDPLGPPGLCGKGTVTKSISFSVPSNNLETIELQAIVGARVGIDTAFGTVGTVSAFADPTLQIDPSFANAGAYQLMLSPGIVNGAIVPEPATNALLIAGLAWIGWQLRRGRRQHATGMVIT